MLALVHFEVASIMFKLLLPFHAIVALCQVPSTMMSGRIRLSQIVKSIRFLAIRMFEFKTW